MRNQLRLERARVKRSLLSALLRDILTSNDVT